MSEQEELARLIRAVEARVPLDAADMLAKEGPERIEEVLAALPFALTERVRAHLPQEVIKQVDALRQGPGSLGELMEGVDGLLPITATVQDAVAFLRAHTEPQHITYLYVNDAEGRLAGMIVIRDLLLASSDQPLSDIMLPDPFALEQDMALADAVRAAVYRHYPVYPVVDARGKMVGLIRGWRLFEKQAVEISAQSGQMVGVAKEERVYTPVLPAFAKRHPWLQVNLLMAFGSAFVVSLFSDTVERIVVLAAFLPVLSCLAGNNGCQTLSITLRGLTLGDFDKMSVGKLLRKEMMMGALNGLGAGLVCAAVMYLFAQLGGSQAPETLAAIMLISMIVGCVTSCLLGTLVPLTLKRAGADPATASSLFVLTFTDLTVMGFMLFLANAMIPA
jgi:magnesium transporter